MKRRGANNKQLAEWVRKLRIPKSAASLDASDVAYEAWRHRFFRDRLRLALSMALVIYFTFIILELLRALKHSAGWEPTWLAMAATVELCLLTSLLLHKTPLGHRYPAFLFLGCSWSITLVEQAWATLRGVALPGIFAWTLVFLAQATLIPVRWPLHLLSQVGVLVYYVGVNGALGLKEVGPFFVDTTFELYLFWFCFICDLAVYLYERLQRAEFKTRCELQAEQEKSNRLLLNILPEAIAERLKQGHNTIAESFAEVTVLFADIVGFTQMSTLMPPQELVNLLNQIFSEFDRLAEQHGLEKIKTIGDAYMVVGGLPVPRVDHALAVAAMALDMQLAIAEFNLKADQNFSIRIGINTGPVVAGVIGIKKFIYDLWGDTVNTASHMESHGLPSSIQVTAATYEYLKEQYLLNQRGLIKVKGKGEMMTYLLIGKRSI